jgi:hypothetical protein
MVASLMVLAGCKQTNKKTKNVTQEQQVVSQSVTVQPVAPVLEVPVVPEVLLAQAEALVETPTESAVALEKADVANVQDDESVLCVVTQEEAGAIEEKKDDTQIINTIKDDNMVKDDDNEWSEEDLEDLDKVIEGE